MVRSKLEVPGQIEVIPIRYGYFDAFRFWSPFWTRKKPVEKVYIQIRVALQKYKRDHPDAKLSIIAHSFGTYVVGQILKRGFDLQIHRLILCSSVLPQDFPWHEYQGRFADDKVVNECGKADIWPVLAQSASWGYGASGTHGFGAVLVKDRFHAGGHGQYFDSGFVEKYWEPFIRRGEYRGTAFETKMPPTPWWLSVVGILPLQWMIVALIVLALALATWLYYGMNVTPFRSRLNTESSAYSHKQPLKPVLPDDIDIALASFIDYEGDVRAPRLDLKLTNMGARPAFITQVKVNVKRTWRLRDLPQVPGVIVPPGHNYVVKLKPREGPYQETKGLSEGLGKDEFGRFSLQFEEDPWAASNTIYLAQVELIANSDEATYKTKDLLFLITMRGCSFPSEQQLQEIIAGAKSLSQNVDMAAINEALTENKRIILEADKIQAVKNTALLKLIESAKASPLGQP
ncbi:MAG: hypothetical protein ABSH35_03120 [Isosphaeraceae bacterium]|jgi:hypothetical protein